MSRKRIIIVAALVLFLLIVILVSSVNRRGFQPESKVTTDPITGEMIRTTNNTPEQTAQGKFVTILGAAELSEHLSQVQIARFRENINIYLTAVNLSDIKTIKVVPKSIVYVENANGISSVKAEALLGETNQKIQLEFTLLGLTGLRITYTNPALQANRVYKTDNLEAPEEDDHSHEEGDLYLPPEDR